MGKHPGGRKQKYDPERVAIICEAIAAGDTMEVAAKKAGVHVCTIYDWQATKPEFSEAIKMAKAKYDEWILNGILDDAKRSLKTLICGQEYEEVKTEYEQDPSKGGAPRIKKQTRTTKKVLPNPTAVIFALCNRDSEHWQNRISNELSGKIETENTGNAPSLINVPNELLAQVIDAINGKK